MADQDDVERPHDFRSGDRKRDLGRPRPTPPQDQPDQTHINDPDSDDR